MGTEKKSSGERSGLCGAVEPLEFGFWGEICKKRAPVRGGIVKKSAVIPPKFRSVLLYCFSSIQWNNQNYWFVGCPDSLLKSRRCGLCWRSTSVFTRRHNMIGLNGRLQQQDSERRLHDAHSSAGSHVIWKGGWPRRQRTFWTAFVRSTLTQTAKYVVIF